MEASKNRTGDGGGLHNRDGHAGDDDDDDRAPSLIESSALSDNSPADDDDDDLNHPRNRQHHGHHHDRPKLREQESGSSFDAMRPTSMIEVDPVPNCGNSVISMQSGITMSEQTEAYSVYSDTNDTFSSDGFGRLERDTSHWMVGGMDSPRLVRCFNPTVISEDGTYDTAMIPPSIENWQYQGFGMQPPPFSNAIVNRWS